MSNVNPQTGIRYGVTSHNQTLINEIFDCGTDESFEAYKRGCVEKVKSVLEDCGQRNAEEDAKAIVDNFEWDDYQCDEAEYSYTDPEGNKFLLSWLGGAPLVWVIQSNRIVKVKSLCSPCVPNAADLDSGLDDDGYECYGIPEGYPEDLD